MLCDDQRQRNYKIADLQKLTIDSKKNLMYQLKHLCCTCKLKPIDLKGI